MNNCILKYLPSLSFAFLYNFISVHNTHKHKHVHAWNLYKKICSVFICLSRTHTHTHRQNENEERFFSNEKNENKNKRKKYIYSICTYNVCVIEKTTNKRKKKKTNKWTIMPTYCYTSLKDKQKGFWEWFRWINEQLTLHQVSYLVVIDF